RSARRSCRTPISPIFTLICRHGRSRRPAKIFRCSIVNVAPCRRASWIGGWRIGYSRAPRAIVWQGDTTMTGKGQMRLGAFFNPTGHHVASWRHPRAQADAGINFQHYVEIARTAEWAKLDRCFWPAMSCVRDAKVEALCRSAQYIANFEPLTLLSALATH